MTVAERIREGLGKCSPAERRVGRLLLSDYPAAGLDTVARLAERADTSGPTVLRFLSRLGFDGFGDLQDALRGEIAERTASPLSLLSTDPAALADDSLLSRAHAVLPAATAHTLETLPRDEVETAVALLADRRYRVSADGGRFTRLLAEYLVLHLMQVRGDSRLLPTQPLSRTDVLLDVELSTGKRVRAGAIKTTSEPAPFRHAAGDGHRIMLPPNHAQRGDPSGDPQRGVGTGRPTIVYLLLRQ